MERIQFAIVILMFCVAMLTVAIVLISNAFRSLEKRLEILEERAKALDQPHPPNRETDSPEQFARNVTSFLPKEAYCAGGCGKLVPYLGPESHLICRECLDKSVDKVLHHSV